MFHPPAALGTASDGALAATQWLPAQTFSGEFLEWAVVFFILAIVAAVLGARGIAGLTMAIAKWLVIIFVVLALVTLIL